MGTRRTGQDSIQPASEVDQCECYSILVLRQTKEALSGHEIIAHGDRIKHRTSDRLLRDVPAPKLPCLSDELEKNDERDDVHRKDCPRERLDDLHLLAVRLIGHWMWVVRRCDSTLISGGLTVTAVLLGNASRKFATLHGPNDIAKRPIQTHSLWKKGKSTDVTQAASAIRSVL